MKLMIKYDIFSYFRFLPEMRRFREYVARALRGTGCSGDGARFSRIVPKATKAVINERAAKRQRLELVGRSEEARQYHIPGR